VGEEPAMAVEILGSVLAFAIAVVFDEAEGCG
jgi:hypothetical protein